MWQLISVYFNCQPFIWFLLLLIIDKFALKCSNSSLFCAIVRWIIGADPYQACIIIRLRRRTIIPSYIEIWACFSSNTIIQRNIISIMVLIVFSMPWSKSSTWTKGIWFQVTSPSWLWRKRFILWWVYYVSGLKSIIEESLFGFFLFFKDKRCLLRSDLV